MDWKSTAVIAGAGILATWFFSLPPRPPPAGAVAPAARVPQTSASRIDIEKEAARLQVHRVEGPHYTQPSRNPFRFNARPEPSRATAGVVEGGPAPVSTPP